MNSIVHNSIILDGSLTNFKPNMGLHYQIAGNYKPDIHLIGSNTVKLGLESYEKEVPPEEEKDFQKPNKDISLPYLVIPDTKGILKRLLHTCRIFEFCKDVIVLVSEKTPKKYLDYVKERNYEYHAVGKDHVDLKAAFELLYEIHQNRKTLFDTGRILSNLLLENGLMSDISLLVHPIIVSRRSYNIFRNIIKNVNLKLEREEIFDKSYVWLVYKVVR